MFRLTVGSCRVLHYAKFAIMRGAEIYGLFEADIFMVCVNLNNARDFRDLAWENT